MSGVNRLAELKQARKAKLAALQQAEEEQNNHKSRNKSKNKKSRYDDNNSNNDDSSNSDNDIELQKSSKSKSKSNKKHNNKQAESNKANKKQSSSQTNKNKKNKQVDSDNDNDDNNDNDSDEIIENASTSMNKYTKIKQQLEQIKQNTDKLKQLKLQNKTVSTQKQRQQLADQLNTIISTTTQYATSIKKQLDMINTDNKKNKSSGTKKQIDNNLYNTFLRKFQAIMTDYNTIANQYKTDLQKRSKRELKIIDPTLDDNKINEIVSNGQTQDYIKQALVSDNLRDAINSIETRHIEIIKLEHQVLEIYELFRDLAVLVDLQSESLDIIAEHIEQTDAYTKKAEKNLHEAEDYQKKARSKQCCCIMVLLIVLVVVLAPVLLTQVGHF